MITDAIVGFFLDIVNWILGFLPTIDSLPGWLGDAVNMIAPALSIFPADVWIITVLNVSLWYGILFGWSVIEWVYKKVPGVD